MKINFQYADGDEETVSLTEEKAKQELINFLNRFSDAGKKQWMSRIKKRDRPLPLQDAHYDWAAQMYEKFLDKN